MLPAKKGKDGQIEESAEAFIGFQGGNRSFPVAYLMDDRRHRPMGLKPGENAQYDDIGQMTLMRRNGTYVLSLDSEDESQTQTGTPEQRAAAQAASGGKESRAHGFDPPRREEKAGAQEIRWRRTGSGRGKAVSRR